jgi:hypothetical protein
MRLAGRLVAALAGLIVAAGPTGNVIASDGDEGQIEGIEEASGVTRLGDRLYIVGDDEAGTYYSYPIADDAIGRIPIHPHRLTRHRLAAGRYAMDLESINFLADGRVVILSERLSALFDEEGVATIYGRDFSEFGGRGFEGLAVRPLADGWSRIALLWEGGYPDASRLPASVRDRVCFQAIRPLVIIHDLGPGAVDQEIRQKDLWREFELNVPLPAGNEPEAQRFRCPDLVWHELDVDGRRVWGFIVLMSSGYAVKPTAGSPAECPKTTEKGKSLRWCYKWLQRFTLDGEPYGERYDLDDVFPEIIRPVNWEGMGWFVPGESLVFVYDEKLAKRRVDPQEAFVLPLPEGW